MKKYSIFHNWGEKFLLFILAFIAFLFFSNDFGIVDIEKSALILAAAVDRTPEGTFAVTADIAVPQEPSSGSKAKEITVLGEGKTVAEAFRTINIKTGWFPKLIFCNVILLGEEAVRENAFDCLGYFFGNEFMSDNCLVAACEGKAADILAINFPTENLTALSLQKILSSEGRSAGNISTNNLKDFARGYYSDHKSSFLPYIRKEKPKESEGETPQTQSVASQSSGSGKSGEGKSGEGKSGKSADDVLNAAQTAAFYEGKMVALLSEEQSFAFNLAYTAIRLATMEVEYEDDTYALGLKEVDQKTSLTVSNQIPEMKISLSARALTVDRSSAQPLMDTLEVSKVNPAVLRKAEAALEENILSAFEQCRAVNCDLFLLTDKLRKYNHDFYAAYKNDLLKRIVPSVSVKLHDLS